MADHCSKEGRSRIMSSIRSKRNKSTELALAKLLRRHQIKGWRRHQDLPGRPDFTFYPHKLVIFVDGDFWHGNPKNYRQPKSNTTYWSNKILQNRRRDSRVNRQLRLRGWTVIRIWESDLKKHPDRCIKRIRKFIPEQGFHSSL